MQCTACHVSLPENARFCPQCGAAAAPDSDEELDPLRETLRVALGRQYEVTRLLGRGGMGAVYLGRETALERDVAIKVLPPDLSMNRDGRERFRREARTAARLSHPNIVPLHTFGDVDGTLFFVMGYVPGESLAARLQREGRIEDEETRRILLEIADALEYAHGLGIIHRDIKPDNVLLDSETGRALLTDFGVAKTLGGGQTMTSKGSLLGTPHYMSPEQAQGMSDVDHRSDLYSLGVMGYAMLAGRVPFEGTTTSEVLVQHITREPVPLKTLVPDVEPELAMAITRCLLKDRTQRLSDARTLKTALTGAEEDDVPVVLSGVDRFPVVFGASLLGLLYFGVWWMFGGDVQNAFVVIAASIAGLQLVVFPLAVWEKTIAARKKGFAFERVLFEIFRQPSWWVGRYPKKFRLRGDLWDRLPVSLRRARNAIMISVAMIVILMIPGMISMVAYHSHWSQHGVTPYPKIFAKISSLSTLFITFGAMIGTAVLMVIWDRRARASGIDDTHVRTHMLGVPSVKRRFWLKPEYAMLLSPARRGSPSENAAMLEAATEVLPQRGPTGGTA
jgi:predicted Ser/Thr protein kinase